MLVSCVLRQADATRGDLVDFCTALSAPCAVLLGAGGCSRPLGCLAWPKLSLTLVLCFSEAFLCITEEINSLPF